MKHTIILFLAAATFCLASCNNSDSSDATITDPSSVNSSSSGTTGTGSAVTGTGSARDTGRMSSSESNSSGSAMPDSSNISNGSAVTGTGSSRDTGKGSIR